MVKRGRPLKTQPTLLLKSQPEAQTSATAGIIDNKKLDPPKANTSHAVRKKVKNPAIIRKSPRINTVSNRELEAVIRLEPVTHEIYISGNQNGIEPLQHEENNSIEVASRAEETEKCSKKDNTDVSDENYKTMYMGSQKKIEALLEENRQLSKALEYANGKVHGYEKQGDMYSKVVAVIASLSRANENLSARVSLGVSDEKNGECDKRNS